MANNWNVHCCPLIVYLFSFIDWLLESAGSPAIHLVAGPSNMTVLAGETVQLECAVSMPSSRDLHIIWARQGCLSWAVVCQAKASSALSVSAGKWNCDHKHLHITRCIYFLIIFVAWLLEFCSHMVRCLQLNIFRHVFFFVETFRSLPDYLPLF